MKKLLSAIMVVVMVLTVFPCVAFAEGSTPVSGVSLSKSELALKIDATSQLTATVLPAEATDKSVTWTSSDESVATVSETGLVTAKNTGIATITVKTVDGEFTSTCTVKVNCGTWGGIDWTLTADGTLTIAPTVNEITKKKPWSGELYEVGEWPAAVNDAITAITGWPYDRAKVKKLVIEEGVTSIGSFVLDGCTTVGGELVIPKTVTYIGQQAFNACGFNKVTFEVYENGQSDLRCIATASFQRQPNVEEYILPDGLADIHGSAFQGCKSLETLYIPESVELMGDWHAHDDYDWSEGYGRSPYPIVAYSKKLREIHFGSEEVRDMFIYSAASEAIISDTYTSTLHIDAYNGLIAYVHIADALKNSQSGDTIGVVAPNAARKPVVVKENDVATIPAGVTLVIPEGMSVTNKGSIVNNGTIINFGTIDDDYDGSSIVNNGVYAAVDPENDSCNLPAEEKVQLYSISYNLNGGAVAVSNPGYYIKGQEKLTLTDPAKPNFVFVDWYVDEELTEAFVFGEQNGNITLYAKWADARTVSFVTNGGSAVAEAIVADGSTLTPPAVPTKPGYIFAGWYTDEELTMAYDFNTPVTEAFTLYAQWAYIPVYTVDAPEGVKASSTNAYTGTPISVTPEGDGVDVVRVVDSKGNLIPVSVKDGVFGFNMPSKNVKIEAFANPFTDVEEDAYYDDAVIWGLANGFTQGTSETTFSPVAACSRAEMLTFLWRTAGSPEPVGTVCDFTDVDADAYYIKALLWAIEKGIVNGTSESTFSPEAACSRAETAAFLCRLAKGGEAADTVAFDDVAADAYYAAAVQWAFEMGIAEGVGDNKFSPDAACTRAQLITFLYRYIAG